MPPYASKLKTGSKPFHKGKSGKPIGPRLPSSLTNVSGSEPSSRPSRKPKTGATTTEDDPYEYFSGKTRRANVKLDLDTEETIGFAKGKGKGFDDGDEDEDDEGEGGLDIKAIRKRIMDADDLGVIGSEEDEEIDSEEAFEEDDVERFRGFGWDDRKRVGKDKKYRKTKDSKKENGASKFVEINLDEDEDVPLPSTSFKKTNAKSKAQIQESSAGSASDAGSERADSDEEEGDPSEFLDVLDVLDGRAKSFLASDDDLNFADQDEDGGGELDGGGKKGKKRKMVDADEGGDGKGEVKSDGKKARWKKSEKAARKGK